MRKYLTILILLIISAGCTEQVKMDIAGVGESIPSGVSAITWDGKNLIVAKEGIIVFLDEIDTATAGSIIGYEGNYFFNNYPVTITSKENPPYITGIAWQQTSGNTGFIWVADAANKRILKITPQGEVIRKISLTSIYPEDIAFKENHLWIADSKRNKIYEVSTEDGSILSEYLSPVPIPTAITWDGKYLIIAGINFNKPSTSSDNVKIVKLDSITGKVVEEVLPSRYISYPAGMVWIDGRLWISDRNSGYIVTTSDRGIPSEDKNNYKLDIIPPTVKKIEIKEEKQKEEKDTEEAKKAAEEAKRAAEEAKRAAEAAKKAFELQQKK
ncbi:MULTISPECIES: hypothetical protein [Thermodesulfovibrio]|uniref:hypothetical protein n=1 Tax=Thermodesulfovibrio yellowstonii TaxID=28262 RepID=UPI00048DB3B3|nr:MULTISPECIES: hypothetical protein [Thermodesulfovibrio]MDI6865017.1 hypothetical protein [Thermodesulfovibrio yellowstonii]